ncbi:hypothetical protein, partial [Amycolatopsis lurida]|uniref:hypothetical protein n=1 Tax=Amycolatopsis lurida TaxID=31959 RepID=UPI00366331EB
MQESKEGSIPSPGIATQLRADVASSQGDDIDDLDGAAISIGPVPRLPKAAAVKRLIDTLIAQFGHSEEAARAIARAVARPEDTRKRAQLPVEERVPGGTVLT